MGTGMLPCSAQNVRTSLEYISRGANTKHKAINSAKDPWNALNARTFLVLFDAIALFTISAQIYDST
ncbi:MAG: hypothetical protein KBA60_08135 [Flavobacteriales bacterium]|jgi:hypothetical protein|nr:hypothetical protein [Flavobacteriales bacterium]HQV74563.1 hypothetical protein [Flavobacteriales bacterium]HQW39903.1 hypothetical protein [Flavobacteriales bacterium]